MTITETSKETEVARSTIYTWIKENNTKPKRTTPFNMREELYLKQKCEQQKK